MLPQVIKVREIDMSEKSRVPILRLWPAVAAGVTDRLWTVADLAALVEAAELKPSKRAPYKKRVAA